MMPLDKTEVEAQLAAQAVLGYLRDVVTVSDRETWTREELLIMLDWVRSNRDLFDAEIVYLYDRIQARHD